MSSHSQHDSTSDQNDQRSTDSNQQSPPSDHHPTTTVMIYLAGDNNLTDECVYALTELKRANASDLVKIYVQFDPSDEFLPTQRYEINRLGHPDGPLAEDLIQQFPFYPESTKALKIEPPYGEQRERKGESGTGDPRMLFNFVAFCVDEPHKPHPTKTDHYVLIICGHGAGIQRDYLLRDNRPEGYLTIYELRSAIKLMRQRLRGKDPHRQFKLDLFGMDVCLMSMAEITYEFRDLIDIVIGCESYSPSAGWPYFETIRQIDQCADKAREALTENVWGTIAKEIVTTYIGFYSNYWLGGLSVTMSALRVRKVGELTALLNLLTHKMIYLLRREWKLKHPELSEAETNDEGGDQGSESADEAPNNTATDYDEHGKRYPPLLFSDALVLAHWRAQSYNGELYVDLADFCDCLVQYVPENSDIAKLCEILSDFIKNDFTLISCSFGRNYQYSYGVSIYFPWQTMVPYYGASISFPEDSNWIRFLELYLKVTRREPRPHNCEPHPEQFKFDLREKLFEVNFSGVRMGPDRMGPDRMGLDEGGNPIHSMRNPPIVFIPDCCTSPEVRRQNAIAQWKLMQGEFPINKSIRNSRIKALEEKNPSWLLLTEEAPVDPADSKLNDVDAS